MNSETRLRIHLGMEEAALAAHKTFGFNPGTVLTNMRHFSGGFFQNTPRGFRNDGCVYLRDTLTHSAIVFNRNTKAVALVKPREYWPKEMLEQYRDGDIKGALKVVRDLVKLNKARLNGKRPLGVR